MNTRSDSSRPAYLLIVLLGFAIVIGAGVITFLIAQNSGPGSPADALSGIGVTPPGDPAHFDPVAQVEAIRATAAPGMQLASLDLNYVRSDGMLDLTASYGAYASYRFAKLLSAPPPGAPPVGVKGVTNDLWYDVSDVDVRHSRMIAIRGSAQFKGLITEPLCSTVRLWNAAKEHGVPDSAVATVRANAAGYTFTISALLVSIQFGPDCQIISGRYGSPTAVPTLTPRSD